MAEKLSFTLVAPAQQLFPDRDAPEGAALVDHVICPGAEGEFGVLAKHAPFMAVLKPGPLRILNEGAEQRIFVNGGFADVTPAGLTVLAEDAVDLATVDPAGLDQDLRDARDDLNAAKDDAKRAAAEKALARLEAIKGATAR
jgi:F-type H+-transporting ATPase subunit epsilon